MARLPAAVAPGILWVDALAVPWVRQVAPGVRWTEVLGVPRARLVSAASLVPLGERSGGVLVVAMLIADLPLTMCHHHRRPIHNSA